MKLSERLIARRQIVDTCWRFDGAHDRCGYGRISVRSVNETAHRAAWLAFRGDPGDLHVLHNKECRYRDCFNPDHLHLGTHQQNMAERDTWGHGIRGERVGVAVLTADQVLQVRELRAAGQTWARLGATFGVHPSTVRHAASGYSWTHL